MPMFQFQCASEATLSTQQVEMVYEEVTAVLRKPLYRAGVAQQTFPDIVKIAAKLRNPLITPSSPLDRNNFVQDGVIYHMTIVQTKLGTAMPNVLGLPSIPTLRAQLRVIDNVAPVAAGGDIATTTEDNRLAGVSVFGDPDAIISPEVYLHQASVVCREVNERKGCLTSPPNDHWSMVHAHAVVKEWNRFLHSF
jgi:hypothetical protein